MSHEPNDSVSMCGLTRIKSLRTLMASVHVVQAVERLARKYLRRPVVITIGSAGKAVDRITQRVTVVKDNEKPPLLEREITWVIPSLFTLIADEATASACESNNLAEHANLAHVNCTLCKCPVLMLTADVTCGGRSRFLLLRYKSLVL